MNTARRDADWLAYNRPQEMKLNPNKPTPVSYDSINPNHYKGDRQFEPIAVIEDWDLNYHLGNAVKYIARNGRKPGEDPREGINKAIWYLQRYLEVMGCCGDVPCECEPTCDSGCEGCCDDQEEIEFRALGDIPNSVMFGDDRDVPFSCTYEDILEERIFDAMHGYVSDVDDQALEHWIDSDYAVRKDLDKFETDEVVFTTRQGGYIIGHKKNQETVILGRDPGFGNDNAPSEFEPR